MWRRLALVALLLIGMMLSSACVASAAENLSAPSAIRSMEEVLKINLKQLDLERLTKTPLTEWEDLILSGAQGYQLDYRYLDSTITVRILKFTDPTTAMQFGNSWYATLPDQTPAAAGTTMADGESWSAKTAEAAIKAWSKENWFTYVSVPVAIPDSESLLTSVCRLVNSHYQALEQGQQ